MKFALVCLLAIPAVFGLGLDDVPGGSDLGLPDIPTPGDLAGEVAKELVTDLVTKGVTEIAGDKIGGQVGGVAGELAGTLAKCYVDGAMTGGASCADSVVKAALDKAGKEIVDDLKQDAAAELNKLALEVSKMIQGAIGDVSKKISDELGGELGTIVGGALGDALTKLAGEGIKDAVNAIVKPPANCVDRDSICPSQKNLCTDKLYAKLMSEQCCKTCSGSAASSGSSSGASTGTGTATSTCKDLQSYCTANKSLCINAAYKSMMTTNCPKTCGICK